MQAWRTSGHGRDGKPAHGGVKFRERQRIGERIAAEMRHPPLETGTKGQIDADLVQLRLQLQCRDVASRGVGKVTGGAADARSHVEHAARGSKPERLRRRTDGVGAVIVPLIDGKELLGPNRLARADTECRQCARDPIEVRVERHRTDRRLVTHGRGPLESSTESRRALAVPASWRSRQDPG